MEISQVDESKVVCVTDVSVLVDKVSDAMRMKFSRLLTTALSH